MKFGKTFTNKLVSYADRYFTYDSRHLKREDSTQHFDFVAFKHENGHTTSVFIRRSQHGIWVSINKARQPIYQGFLKTYQEVDTFKKMIRCLG